MILQRLWDREKFPRKLWYPYFPEESLDEEEWQEQFGEVSEILRSSMFILLGYAAFCAVTLGQTDEQILKTAGFTLPVIGSTVSVKGFMLFGPLILIALTFYLHIFLGLWLSLRGDKTDKNLRPPYMFNLANRTSANLSFFIFYWLPPIILFAFARKGAPFIDGEIISYYAALDWLEMNHEIYFQNKLSLLPVILACSTTIAISILAIRRRPSSQRDKNRIYWAALPVLVFVLFASLFDAFWSRPLGLLRSDFSGQDLRKARLDSAQLFHSNLQGSDLRDASLKNANIGYANLVGAKLSFARISDARLDHSDLSEAKASKVLMTGSDLSDAELISADLSEAILHRANLTNADMAAADLSEASLRRANLAGANLTGAKLGEADLRFADLSGANLNRAVLTGADLRMAKLNNANLSEATLNAAKMRNTDLEGADLAFAHGLTCEQVQETVGTPKTLPDYLPDICRPMEKTPVETDDVEVDEGDVFDFEIDGEGPEEGTVIEFG